MKGFVNYHINVINNYIKRYNYKSYLEIGVDTGHCFRSINCDFKIGVDPDKNSFSTTHYITSDEFFSSNQNYFDIIFVDGLHHSDQVIKDINNSLKFLNPNGTIIVHDCMPELEIEQIIPRNNKVWTGDVWKAWVEFRKREDLRMFVFDVDYGIGVIQRGEQIPLIIEEELTWENFMKNKHIWLNLISYA